MFNWLRNVCRCSWISGSKDDTFISSVRLNKHLFCEYSMAAVQANLTMEDVGHVTPAGNKGTFVGVYDGHGGDEASQFVSDHLLTRLYGISQQMGSTMSHDILTQAFSETENEFISSVVEKKFENDPKIAAVGSCALVGVIWGEKLYVANLGDSRAVLGYFDVWNRITAEQLTKDHNANLEVIRTELRTNHPDDPNIVTSSNPRGNWLIKGIIEVSRAIGDAFLKYPQFSLNELIPRFSLGETMVRPILRHDPDVTERSIGAVDRFIIFASHGLWDCLTNQSAVEIVHNNPRKGVAKKLVRAALEEVARRNNVTYKEIKQIHKNFKRKVHDDMAVVVLFLDHDALTSSFGNDASTAEENADTPDNDNAEPSNEGETSAAEGNADTPAEPGIADAQCDC